MPEESVDKGFAGKIGVVMRVPLKQGKSKLNISRYVKQH